MKRKAIILVHGMGRHRAPEKAAAKDGQPAALKPGAFGDEFLAALAENLAPFAAHKGKTLEELGYDLHEINYDAWFDEVRAALAEQGKDMEKAIGALGGKFGLSVPYGLVEKLTSLQAGFDSDKFFYTHWLDVIFYGSLLGAKVRAVAAATIADVVSRYGGANVHLIAHSLGTAVAHDTLHVLYKAQLDDDMKERGVKPLNPITHQLASIWMFANVSRLVNSVTGFANPLASIVRPGDQGCATTFVNVRHKLDPFTWLACFDPANDDSWLPGPLYATAYSNIVTDLVADPNTHSFTQYLRDPHVSVRLARLLLFPKFAGTEQEIADAATARAKESLAGKYAQLEDALENAVRSNEPAGWKDFLVNATAHGRAVLELGGKFPS
ncbi:MAG TPA: hypothetical protein VEB66_01690 [Opitutaceae bacterium]|nr:hypothetical protein [Opitutaceae bacterium]